MLIGLPHHGREWQPHVSTHGYTRKVVVAARHHRTHIFVKKAEGVFQRQLKLSPTGWRGGGVSRTYASATMRLLVDAMT